MGRLTSPLRSPGRWFPRGLRQRSQSVVEYGLIAASVAFVGVVAFTALADAQKAYLADFPRNLPPPSAPGSLLHDTTILIKCPPNTPTPTPNPLIIKLGTQVQCNVAVEDVYQNQIEVTPPKGKVDWLFDGVPLSPGGQCRLEPVARSLSTSQCPVPISWTPTTTANSRLGDHQLVAIYTAELSNHRSGSRVLDLQYVENLVFVVNCLNDWWPTESWVELGHPLRCTLTLTNLGSGTAVKVPTDTRVTWSTSDGQGLFTCSSVNPDNFAIIHNIWGDRHCTEPKASFDCLTDANSGCAVIYRRQYDALGSPVGSTPVLTLTAKVNPAASLTSVPFPDKINVVPQRHDLHPIGVVALCTATPGTGVSFDNASVFLMRGDVATKAEFLGTNKISVTGRAGTFQCSVSVADTDGSPASECDYLIPCGNPDKADSYPPIGTVSLTLNNTPVPNVRCRLDNKMGTPEPPTKQAIGQAPFVSSCKLPAVTIERPPPGGLTLRVEYNKAWIPPPRTLDPAHDRGSYAIPIVAATPP